MIVNSPYMLKLGDDENMLALWLNNNALYSGSPFPGGILNRQQVKEIARFLQSYLEKPINDNIATQSSDTTSHPEG